MKPYQKLLALFAAFIALRLAFILTFPPFTDESLYVRWGQLMVNRPELMWASISYLKRQPLGFWLFGSGAILFHNPLLGGRLIVLLANIPTLFITYFVTKRFTSEKTAFTAALILTLSPLFILIQSLILMDGLLIAIGAAIIWIFMMDWGEKAPYYVVSTGILLGIALWIKTTALFFVFLSVTGLLIKAKQEHHKPLITLALLGTLIGLPLLLLTPLGLRSDVGSVLSEPESFTFSMAELTHNPVGLWSKNIFLTLYSMTLYVHPLVFIALPAATALFRRKTSMFLLSWFLVPAGATTLLGKNFQIRYFAFGVIALLPFVAYGIDRALEKTRHVWVRYACWTILTLYSLFFIFRPVLFFSLFPEYSGERDYALSWPSGYGIPELVRWIDTHAPADGPLLVAVADSPGNPSDYLMAYYYFKPNVQIAFATLTSITEFQKLQPIANSRALYLATRSTLIPTGIQPYLIPIRLFPKPNSKETVGIYRVTFSKIIRPL